MASGFAFLHHQTSVLSYLINAKPLNKILIKLFGSKSKDLILKVYDGPGTFSTELTATEDHFYTSTFQCTFVIAQFASRQATSLHISQYARKLDQNIVLKNNTHKNIAFPSSHCIVVLSTQPSLKFNITVNRMAFQGKDYFSCFQGGLMLIETRNREIGIGSKLCQNFSTSQLQKRSVYSTLSHAYLLLLSYPGYSRMQVDLRVATMKCQFLSLSPCMYYKHCSHVDIWHCNLKIPNKHIKFTTVEGFVEKSKYGGIRMIYTPTNTHMCTVLQFTEIDEKIFSNQELNHGECVIELFPDYTPGGFTKALHHNIRAFLDFGSTQLQNLTISFCNLGKKFNVKTIYASYKNSHGKLIMNKGILHSRRIAGRSDNEFFAHNYFYSMYVNANFRTVAHHRNMLRLFFVVHPEWTVSWLDVSVWMSEFTQTINNLPLPGGVRREMFFGNTLDLTTGILASAEGTIQFLYGKVMKDKFSFKRYLYAHAHLGGKTYLKWSMETTAECLTRGYELSLPRNRVFVMCCKNRLVSPQSKCDPCNNYFGLAITHGRYKAFSHVVYQRLSPCTVPLVKKASCAHFSHLHHHHLTIMWFSMSQSWIDSYFTCSAQEAKLPIFFDTAELNEFLALIKFSKETLITEAIFIDFIQTNKPANRVSSFKL